MPCVSGFRHKLAGTDVGDAEAAEAFALRMVPPYRAASLNDRDPGPCHTSSYSASVVTGNLLSRV